MKATAFDADHVRWELPLSEAWPYYHSARLLEGETFRWPEDLAKQDEWLQSVRRRFQNPRLLRSPITDH